MRKAVENMNITRLEKYGYAPAAVEEKATEIEKFRDTYDFYRLVKVKQHAERNRRADIKNDEKLHKN